MATTKSAQYQFKGIAETFLDFVLLEPAGQLPAAERPLKVVPPIEGLGSVSPGTSSTLRQDLSGV